MACEEGARLKEVGSRRTGLDVDRPPVGCDARGHSGERLNLSWGPRRRFRGQSLTGDSCVWGVWFRGRARATSRLMSLLSPVMSAY